MSLSTTPPSEPVAAPCLDAGAFPHIIDNVFRHADRTALVRLRRVSRACRDRADSLLARHLVCAGDVVGSSRDHRIPAWYTALDLADWPFGKWISHEAIRASRWARLATATRSLDLVEAPGKHSMALLSRSLLTPLATLRVWLSLVEPNYPTVTVPAYTIVIVAWAHRPFHPPIPVREPDIIPTQTLRKVVYIVTRQYWNHPYLLNSLFSIDHVDLGITVFRPLQVVVIISPDQRVDGVASLVRPARNVKRFLAQVVELALYLLDLIKVTIVDAQVLPTQLAPVKFISPYHPLVEVDFEEYTRATFTNLGKIQYYHSQWRWVTREEYRLEVGPHQFALETGEDVVLPLHEPSTLPASPLSPF